MLLTTTATAPSCQLSPCMKNSSDGEERRRPRRSRPCAASCAPSGRPWRRRSGSTNALRDGREAGQVERQRAGGEVQAEHVDGPAAGLVGVRAAGGPAGDGDHVRREEHRQRRSCRRPSWPSRTSSRPAARGPGPAGRGRRCRGRIRHRSCRSGSAPRAALDEHVPEYVGAVGDQAVDTTVEQLAHLVGVVDGPDVHVLAGGVGPAYEPGGGDAAAPAPVGDLQRGRPGRG